MARELRTTNDAVARFSGHFEGQYARARELILSFKMHSRLAWTRLTQHEVAVATKARLTFETIPEFVLHAQRETDPYTLALVHELLGVSAFYANDVEGAVRCLEGARMIYGSRDPRPEDLYGRAFASHFLGLIEHRPDHRARVGCPRRSRGERARLAGMLAGAVRRRG